MNRIQDSTRDLDTSKELPLESMWHEHNHISSECHSVKTVPNYFKRKCDLPKLAKKSNSESVSIT